MAAAPSLMAPALDLDMDIYSRHFADPIASCTEMNSVPMLPREPSPFPERGLLMEEEKSLAMEFAVSSLDELVKMYQVTELLWIRSVENEREMLNFEERARMFSWPLNRKHHSCELGTEVSRDTAVVIMNSVTLVDAFLDARKCMELFPTIVSRAKAVQVISSGGSAYSCSLQLMQAKLQILSPLLSTRETHFLRY